MSSSLPAITGLLPLSSTAHQTLLAMSQLAEGAMLHVSPLCAEHPDGQRDVRGWVLDTPSVAPATCVPVGCCMFDGISVVRCDVPEEQILQLLLNETDTRRRLGEAVGEILRATAAAPEKRATWQRCRPTANGHPRSLHSVILSPQPTFFQPQDCSPVMDSEPWQPELSPEGFVGLFHHWHTADLRRRSLTLYIACQSYLPRAALEVADMVRGAGDAATAAEVAMSEEMHWLRTASSRNRARILAQVCTRMGLRFPAMTDYHAQLTRDPPRLAICATETLHHDAYLTPCGKTVRVLNYCSDASRSHNGAACAMAPWDGLWIFHGSNAHACAQPGDFGSAHGVHFLPTASPRLPTSASGSVPLSTADPRQCRPLQVWPDSEEELAAACAVVLQPALPALPQGRSDEGIDADVLEVYRRSLARQLTPVTLMLPGLPGSTTTSHVRFDEGVLQAMVKRGWVRAHGYTSLIPIACALVDTWRPCSDSWAKPLL